MDVPLDEFQVRQFQTSGGGRIFQIPMLEFPGLSGYAYLVLIEDASDPYRILIDSGSGFGISNQQLEAGLQVVSGLIGEPFGFPDLTHILITHGHIDHFGGLTYVRPRTPALIGVHELDLRNLTNYEERLTVVARRLDEFLQEAGVSAGRRLELLRPWAKGIRLTLGGHNEPITDLNSRIETIQQVHAERLDAVLGLLEHSHTVLEISQALFGEVHGYNALLALEEAGAHVEYLYQRGRLGIDNLDELENTPEPAPIRYRCLPRYAG